ncbi:MAG: 3-isopropylmalate dehydratase small subunit [Deltaproteobacteria bacterium]|nr:3-isopropylmalate dehydratase small subunit [Deltaproteobacteria bacterium]
MPKFDRLTSRVVPLKVDDIDTDQIIPARYLKVTSKEGLGPALFTDWRAPGKPGAVLDSDEAKGCEVLLAGHNFGCGSSREHAPWALCGYGFRAVVASSFADIFKGNALKNGLLPVQVDPEVLERLHAARAADPSFSVTIDLETQELTAPSVAVRVSFPVDPFARTCLLEGVDELGYLLKHLPEIEAHERRP